MKKRTQLLLLFVVFCLESIAFAGGITFTPKPTPPNPWLITLGGFGGYSGTDFEYGGTYFSSDENQVLNNDAFQQGVSGGGQIGIQYHFHRPYYLGLAVSVAAQAQKARLVEPMDNLMSSLFVINLKFHLQYNVDIAALMGTDITPQTHLYAKVGASAARFRHSLETSEIINRRPPFPILVPRQSQGETMWGWVVGVGLVHDLSRWFSVFAEVDHNHYNRRNLNPLDNIPIVRRFTFPSSNHLTQNVKITTNILRMGVNLKLMDTFSPMHVMPMAAPWMIYLGGFGGYSGTDFDYGGTFFTQNAFGPTRRIFNNDVFQQGVSGGGQVGIQYHFHNPYFLGLVASAAAYAQKARLTTLIRFFTMPNDDPMSIQHEFRLQNNVDIAALMGADITTQTHLYAKVGASAARFLHTVATGELLFISSPIFIPRQRQPKTIWGWVVGVGLVHDLSRWFSVFAEYDHNHYTRRNLNPLDNIDPTREITFSFFIPDHTTQNVKITTNTLRMGVNVKLMGTFSPMHVMPVAASWMITFGGFGGYSSTDFEYGSTYFARTLVILRTNQIFNNDVFQQGASGGGQVGIQYHFHRPYSLGLVVSAAAHAQKARLANNPTILAVSNPFNIQHEFRLQHNVDIAALMGADITAQTHVYAKVGASAARLKYRLLTQPAPTRGNPPETFILQQTQNETIWGWVVGVGLAHDLSRWFNVFAEYDHNHYTRRNLNPVDNINPLSFSSPILRDHLTQHVKMTTNTVRVGMNVTFRM